MTLPLACQQLDRDYVLDVVAFRADFAGVDVSDPGQLRKWFTDYSYLSANDLARIAGVAVSTIYRWRGRAGLTAQRFMARPPKVVRPDPVAPSNWRDTTWLEDNYGQYSIPQLARATNRNYETIRRRLLRRLGALRSKRESVRSQHPCCRRGWLLDHYVVQGLSVQRCARLAGVSRLTMTCWLADQKIRIRSGTEQVVLNNVTMAKAPGRPPQRPPPPRRGG